MPKSGGHFPKDFRAPAETLAPDLAWKTAQE